MRSRKKKTFIHKKRKPIIIIIAVFIVITACIIKIEYSVRTTAVLRSKHAADKIANEIIGDTVKSYIGSNKYTYKDFAAVLYNDKQEAVSIETISYNINKVQSDLTILINKKLEAAELKTEDISIGSLTGAFLLVGKGPKIKIKLSPLGSADVKLKSELSDAGLNQTLHKISIIITVKMTSSVPLYNYEIQSEFEFLLAENLIVGKVPALSQPIYNNEKYD